MKLSEIASFRKERIPVENITINSYISTENMLPDKKGVVPAVKLPNQKTVSAFRKNDILVSNIRPYFKKIWKATFDGGCSGDILVFEAKDNQEADFLYGVLSNDQFFDYVMSTSKGTKMPRGDKKAVLDFTFDSISPELKTILINFLSKIERLKTVLIKINQNLEELIDLIFQRDFLNKKGQSKNKILLRDLIKEIIAGEWGKGSEEENYSEKVLCIRGTDIPEMAKGSRGKVPYRYISSKKLNKKVLQNDDIIIEISGGSPTQSTGRSLFVSSELLDKFEFPLVCTNFCKVLKAEPFYSRVVFSYLQYLYKNEIFFTFENGTTGIKNLDLKRFLSSTKLPIQSKVTVENYNTFFDNVMKVIINNSNLIDYLNALRDLLLPKLISGEIDVSEIETNIDLEE